MDKDIALQVTQVREEIAACDPGRDPQRIRLKQTHAGALFAIWMASRHGYLELARSRTSVDAKRERALCDATLGAIDAEDAAPTGEWVGDYSFGSALLRVAATIHDTLKHRYLPLFGDGFCRSETRLEEQASQDGLISEADRRLLAAIREDAAAFGSASGRKQERATTSLNDLIVGLRLVVGVVDDSGETPRAEAAKG